MNILAIITSFFIGAPGNPCVNLTQTQCAEYTKVHSQMNPVVYTDPDPRVTFQLNRDPSWAVARGN